MPTSSSTIESPRCRCISSSVVKGADGDMLPGLRHGTDCAAGVPDAMPGRHPGHDDPHGERIAADRGELDGGITRGQPDALRLDALLQPFLEPRAPRREVGEM